MEYAWHPDEWALTESNMAKAVANSGAGDYGAFLRWSVEQPEAFWRQVIADLGLKWQQPPSRMLDDSAGPAWAKWFVGGKLNLSESALDRHLDAGRGEAAAVIWEGEEGETRVLSYAELTAEVERFAAGLRQRGFEAGDRAGLFVPMTPEVVIGMLAIARLGGIVVPLFSGFGADAIRVRLQGAEARWLISADGVYRRGKPLNMLDTARKALVGAPTVAHHIVVRRTGRVPLQGDEVDAADVAADSGAPAAATDVDDPFMLIFTSGTTGKPKGTVHVHGGFPVKAAQDMYHCFDVRPEDQVFWLTDIGWMMGPWLILGTLLLGATVVMYDGAPDTPGPDRVWRLWDDHNVTIGGISPTFVRAMMPRGAELPDKFALPHLRLLGSTGEPWNPDPWQWAFEHIGKSRAPIINYSGGTEISGGIVGCTVMRPFRPITFNTVVPGIDADVVDDQGRPVRDEIGLLVVKRPNPGMTRSFWRNDERYLDSYWRTFEGIWYHGDLVKTEPDGQMIITGRADDTLKVAGKRLGPAEMESIAVEHPQVIEAAVIGVPDDVKGQVPLVFAVVEGQPADAHALAAEIRGFIGERMGKALQPKAVHLLSELPKTRSGKVMRRVVRRVFLSEDPGDLGSMGNPHVVDELKQLV